MDEGAQVGEADRIATFRHPDRADILVEVDKASGRYNSIIRIRFRYKIYDSKK